MKTIIFTLVMLFSAWANSNNTLYPKDAEAYLKKLGCSFSAYSVYTGPDAKVEMLGELKKGQVYSRAICGNTYSEGGAKKHNFCWVRAVDIKDGVYVGRATHGSVWRDEGGPCSKKSIIKILSNIRGELSTGQNKEWRIVSDTFSAVPNFNKLLDGTLMEEEFKRLKYGKYRWLYWHHTNSCAEMPGNADQNINDPREPSKVLSQSDEKLVIQVRKEKWTYFSSKAPCEVMVKNKK